MYEVNRVLSDVSLGANARDTPDVIEGLGAVSLGTPSWFARLGVTSETGEFIIGMWFSRTEISTWPGLLAGVPNRSYPDAGLRSR